MPGSEILIHMKTSPVYELLNGPKILILLILFRCDALQAGAWDRRSNPAELPGGPENVHKRLLVIANSC